MDEILKALQDNAPAIAVTLVTGAVAALWNRELIQRLFVIVWGRISKKTSNKLDDEILQAAKEAYNIDTTKEP